MKIREQLIKTARIEMMFTYDEDWDATVERLACEILDQTSEGKYGTKEIEEVVNEILV